MTKINHCLAIQEKSSSTVRLFLNEFFYYGDRRYEVIKKTENHLELEEIKAPQSLAKKALKVALLFTLIVPLIAAIYKLVQILKWSLYKQVTIISKPAKEEFSSIQSLSASSKAERKAASTKPSKDLLTPDERQLIESINAGTYIGTLGEDDKDLEQLFQKHGSAITTLLMPFLPGKTALKYLAHCLHVERVSIDADEFSSEDIKSFSELSLGNLKILEVVANPSEKTFEGVKVLAQSKILKNVETLSLATIVLEVEGAKALADSPFLKKIKTLGLDGCRIGDEGVQALAVSGNFKYLEVLKLDSNNISATGARYIAASKNFANLVDLSIGFNFDVGCEGIKSIVTSSGLKRLKRLFAGAIGLSWDEKSALKSLFSDHRVKVEL
jgi:hypothetical protein